MDDNQIIVDSCVGRITVPHVYMLTVVLYSNCDPEYSTTTVPVPVFPTRAMEAIFSAVVVHATIIAVLLSA